MAEVHEGSCHCGAVNYAFEKTLDGPVVGCDCEYCGRTGIVMALGSMAAFTLKSGGDNLTEYHVDGQNIVHKFCKTCGVLPFGLGTGDSGGQVMAVNVRTLTDVEPWALIADDMDEDDD